MSHSNTCQRPSQIFSSTEISLAFSLLAKRIDWLIRRSRVPVEIKKFGNLILIKHKNGWLSAYSNVGRFNVKQGAIIKKGQIIAYSSKNIEYFHFQLRHNRNPVNPIRYLN